MTTRTIRWFRIKDGEFEGKLHLSGWMLSAMRVEDGGDKNGWIAYAICPICAAMVLSDEKHAFGDRTWQHEQWHARTDYPIPEGI